MLRITVVTGWNIIYQWGGGSIFHGLQEIILMLFNPHESIHSRNQIPNWFISWDFLGHRPKFFYKCSKNIFIVSVKCPGFKKTCFYSRIEIIFHYHKNFRQFRANDSICFFKRTYSPRNLNKIHSYQTTFVAKKFLIR